MPRVYVASPFGFSVATRGYYDDVLLPTIAAAGWEALDPWADLDGAIGESFANAGWLSAETRIPALRQINRSLGSANDGMIREAEALFAVLDGPDVDSGTAAEIGFAAALGKPITALRLDTRLTGDNEASVVNLQVQYFIEASGGRVHRTLEAAVDSLTTRAKPR